jgi:AcrR family transcriptional regulator
MDTGAVTDTEGNSPQRPSLRTEQRSSTQERILSALAELMNEGHTTDVALSTVAERAGVGERTVYRHFPTKHELFDALFAWVTLGVRDLDPPRSPDELVERVRTYFHTFARNPEVIRALGTHQVGNEMRELRAGRRRGFVENALAPGSAERDPLEQRQLVAIVHLMSSSNAFLHLHDNYGLTADEAADAIAWAVLRLAGQEHS